MAFVHGKGCAVWVGAYDLSAYLNSFDVTGSADVAEATTFGKNSKVYKMGLKDAKGALKGLYDGDAGAVDEVLQAALGASSGLVITSSPAGATLGNRVSIGATKSTEYQVSTPVNDMVSISGSAQYDGGVDGGVLLAANAAITTTTNGASVDNTAATTNGGAATLHVTANTSDGSTTVKVQHSTDDSVWVDLATFTVVATTVTTAEHIEVAAGTTVNRYTRAQTTLAGSSGVTVTVGFARRY